MKKEEKLERLYSYAQELGLSPQDAAKYFSAKAIENFSAVQAYDMPAKILPGMYVYADGLIYPEIIPNRQIKAVVGYIEGNTAYAVCLREEKLPWFNDISPFSETRELTNEKEANRKIRKTACKKICQADAVQWCHDYSKYGVKPNEAFLPSWSELNKLYTNKKAVNISLKALDATILGGCYCFFIEDSCYCSMAFSMDCGQVYNNSKLDHYYIRPVLKIQL